VYKRQLLTLASRAPAQAETVSLSLTVPAERSQVTLSPVPPERFFACQSPAIPAEMHLDAPLTIAGSDLAPFFQATATTRPVKVRRGGILNDTGEAEEPRFSGRFFSQDAQQAAAELDLQMTLSFCVYRGFLDFVGADYALSGTLGNYRMTRVDTLSGDDAATLALTYSSRNWTADAGGHFLPPLGYEYRADAGQILGALGLTLGLDATPFQVIDDQAQAPLLVDLALRPTLLVTTPQP